MEIDYSNIKVIGFDADDTLWVNETYFRETEHEFARLLSAYETENKIDQELFRTEMNNLELYGYGIKGFMLSMIESAIELSNGEVPLNTISDIIALGKSMIEKPVVLLEGVEEVLSHLKGRYRLFFTDQRRSVRSGTQIGEIRLIDVFSSCRNTQ